MKHLSLKLLSETVVSRRKTMKLSQAALSEKAIRIDTDLFRISHWYCI